jgi:cytochrome c553
MIAVAVTAALFAGGVAIVYALSERQLRMRYAVPAGALDLPDTDASIGRGEHLVRAVTTCTLCHAEDLGGRVYADMGAIGLVAGPNLTRGRGGIGSAFTRADWVRAIRYGVRADGTSLIVMPSEVFTLLDDADLASIVAYLEQVPPVDREVPPTRFGLAGRALLAAGRLNILVAPKTHHPAAVARRRATTDIERGRYLADVGGCHGCHGFGLSGGAVAGPPGLPPAANLTPAGLGGWTLDDFGRAVRTGRRPDGRVLDEFMPWRVYATMTDDEVGALWAYVQSVPPKAFGGK